MSTRTKKSKYTFILEDININQINQTYGIQIPCNITEHQGKNKEKTTKICELHIEKGNPEIISFLDESKRLHTCQISMVDFQSKKDVNLLRYHCYWCKHPFNTIPIGCPIKYVPSQAEKKYYSHISKDTYTIKEDITLNKSKNITGKENLNIKPGDYYETDGVFCSFNCCKSWIDDNKHNSMYDMSSVLLMKMYNNLMNTKLEIISSAPHWRVLEQYGGNLNIIKFRESFNKIDYKYQGITKNVPKFLPVGRLFEENFKF